MTAPNKSHGYTQEQLERMCRGKVRWADEMAARAGALQSLELRPGIAKLYTYRCPICRGHHLTRSSFLKGEPVTLPHAYSTENSRDVSLKETRHSASGKAAFSMEGA